MTKEELKNKCKERAKIFQQAMESCKSLNPMDCIEWFADRIVDLENKNVELLGEIAFTKNALNNAKAQIEKMKCCANCDNWNWKHSKCEKKLKGDCFKQSKWILRR